MTIPPKPITQPTDNGLASFNKTIWLSAKEYVPLQWELANWFCPTNQ
jgi:outer membrane lipoprotein-sorting protein